MNSGSPQSVRFSFLAQRSSSGASHFLAAGLRPVSPVMEPHCRKPAHGMPSSSTVTKPEQGEVSEVKPSNDSLIAFTQGRWIH